MRVSCSGCRVLRKGCSENCTIRPCLQWIKSPESQANATVFLAKFYGRAGLQNLINAGPDHLRPAIFRSLLYEACGRIVNPIYGSAGLLWSNNWQLCHTAVEAVLSGAPIAPMSLESPESAMSPPLKACDIRHVSKNEDSAVSRELRKVRTRGRFKRPGTSRAAKPRRKESPEAESTVDEAAQVMWSLSRQRERDRSGSHDSAVEPPSGDGESGEADSMSVETVEASVAKPDEGTDGSDVELELTLGFGFEPIARGPRVKPSKADEGMDCSDDATCQIELGLTCPAPA